MLHFVIEFCFYMEAIPKRLKLATIPAGDNFTTAFLTSNPLEAECIFRGSMGFAVTAVNNNMKQYLYLE